MLQIINSHNKNSSITQDLVRVMFVGHKLQVFFLIANIGYYSWPDRFKAGLGLVRWEHEGMRTSLDVKVTFWPFLGNHISDHCNWKYVPFYRMRYNQRVRWLWFVL